MFPCSDVPPLKISAYGGGAEGLSDRFVSSFLWLNKLGLTALYNYQVRIDQFQFKPTFV